MHAEQKRSLFFFFTHELQCTRRLISLYDEKKMLDLAAGLQPCFSCTCSLRGANGQKNAEDMNESSRKVFHDIAVTWNTVIWEAFLKSHQSYNGHFLTVFLLWLSSCIAWDRLTFVAIHSQISFLYHFLCQQKNLFIHIVYDVTGKSQIFSLRKPV